MLNPCYYNSIMKKIFSGVKPTGNIHIGNYLGAIKNWVELQNKNEYQSIFCVVDLHAITIPQKPEELQNNILEITAIYLACGIDPEKSPIFVQSKRPEHAELNWLLSTITNMGELNRMTQYKEKSEKSGAGVGLFLYPVLMAADIFLYQADLVPVGDDQTQHVELATDLAKRFNNRFGKTFVVPEIFKTYGSRIMGLDDPTKKMSKTADSKYNWISFTDTDEEIREKIKKAVTDSESEIKAGPEKPALTNLLTIYAGFSGDTIEALEQKYAGKNYGEFKTDLAELLVAKIGPIREKIKKMLEDKGELERILEQGNQKVAPIARRTLEDVKKKMGL